MAKAYVKTALSMGIPGDEDILDQIKRMPRGSFTQWAKAAMREKMARDKEAEQRSRQDQPRLSHCPSSNDHYGDDPVTRIT